MIICVLLSIHEVVWDQRIVLGVRRRKELIPLRYTALGGTVCAAVRGGGSTSEKH